MSETVQERTERGPLNPKRPISAKKKIYDSVFTNLFRQPEYTIQLYRALHPEDTETTQEQIRLVTLENILLNQPYNDIGFLAGDRLLILVEAQSTWSENILVRALVYIAQTIQNHILETKQNIYGSKKVTFPEPEFYVIFTGDRVSQPEQLTLSKSFFGGREAALDVRVRMIYDGKEGDIIAQYVMFSKIYKKQRALYGQTQKAVQETIRVCKDKNVLKAYLENRETEVIDIMMTLFDQEYALEAYAEEIRQEGRAEGRLEGIGEGEWLKLIEIIQKKVKKNTPPAVIADMTEENILLVEQICHLIQEHPAADSKELFNYWREQ